MGGAGAGTGRTEWLACGKLGGLFRPVSARGTSRLSCCGGARAVTSRHLWPGEVQAPVINLHVHRVLTRPDDL